MDLSPLPFLFSILVSSSDPYRINSEVCPISTAKPPEAPADLPCPYTIKDFPSLQKEVTSHGGG